MEVANKLTVSSITISQKYHRKLICGKTYSIRKVRYLCSLTSTLLKVTLLFLSCLLSATQNSIPTLLVENAYNIFWRIFKHNRSFRVRLLPTLKIGFRNGLLTLVFVSLALLSCAIPNHSTLTIEIAPDDLAHVIRANFDLYATKNVESSGKEQDENVVFSMIPTRSTLPYPEPYVGGVVRSIWNSSVWCEYSCIMYHCW